MVKMRVENPLLDTEMTVVRNEFERGENNVQSVLEERVMSTAYLWHNYGKSTIGSRADIERVPIDRLAAFYRKYYQPDNAFITIAGQIDAAKTLQAIAATLGAIPRPTRVLDATYTTEPPQDGERTVELRRVGRGKNLIIAYHGPAMAHPDSAALEVMSGILAGRGGTGRFDKAIIEPKKALSVGMSFQELHDPGFAEIRASLDDTQSIDDVKKTILETVAALMREAPSRDEVDRAKTRILQGMDRTFANSQQLAMQINETIASGDWRLLFTNYEEIRRVTPEDVTRVAKAYFKDSNRTVGVFIPDAAPERTAVPEAPPIDALLKAYTPEIHVNVGDAIDPSPAALERRIQRATAGGIRLAMMSKGTRGDRVQASLTLRFGDEHNLAGKAAAAQMADALLMRGTKTKSRQQIQDEMQRLNATINVGGGGGRGGGGRATGSVGATISTTAENVIPALRLAVEILKEPAFPAADFEQIRQQQIAQIERGRTEPGTLVSQLLQSHLSDYPRSDVRHVRTIDEEIADLKAVTLDDVKNFHRDFFGASHGELVAVGKFDPIELQKAANDLLAPWKSSSPYARIFNTYAPVSPINTKIETPDKENAQFSAGLRVRMNDSDPEYPAMVLANYMFGGGGLTSRFPDRVRNREGLSYSVGTNFTAPVEGDAAAFSASAIANPGNTPKVEASFVDELTRTLRDGFTQQELARAKAAIRDERIGGRSSDGGVLSLLAAREPYGRTLMWDEQMDAKLQALTLDQVNVAFRRYVSAAQVSIVKGGDFKAAGVY